MMNLDKIRQWILSIMILILPFSLLFNIILITNYPEPSSFLVINPQFDGKMLDQAKASGYYSPGNYYCVWTKDRTDEEIKQTDYHEVCHDLVYKDKKHFC